MRKLTTCLVSAMIALSAFAAERNQLTNLPTVFIDTDNKAGINSKSTYTPGSVTVVSSSGQEDCDQVRMGIRGRGNSTWGMAKKPYRIKFDSKIKFLNNKAKAKNWVLLANYADKTLMRNAIAFEISKFMGFEYTPSITFVDVVLNDKYIGNYMVTDQTEVKENRVPVEEQEITDTEEPAITGGYLLEIDGFADSEPVVIRTPKEMKITVKYPKDDEINSAQLAYITKFIKDFETRLFSADFADPETGYRALVDEESLINWYIASELTGNSDALWSTYIYKKREDDHLYFGPLWDYDIAFNNDNRLGEATRKLMRTDGHGFKQWMNQFWKDTWFRRAVSQRWEELVDAGIEAAIQQAIDKYAALLDDSQKLNFERWTVLANRVYLETYLFPTYMGGVNKLKEYITDRCDFLSQSFADTDPSKWAVEINTESTYKIRHCEGQWMAQQGNSVYLTTEDNAHEVKFIPYDRESAYYYMLFPTDKFIGSNDQWTISLWNEIKDNNYMLFAVERSSEAGYVQFKNIGRDRYLGTDGGSAGREVWTDKTANNPRTLWRLFEIKPVTGTDELVAAPTLLQQGSELITESCTGIRLYSTTGALVAATDDDRLSLEGLTPGIYIAEATTNTGNKLRLKLRK